jgi:hypothetical protein
VITVVIPVGPYPANKRWLGECLESIWSQTLRPDEVLIIDDMAAVETTIPVWINWGSWTKTFRVWHSPWRLGVAHAFNFGVGLARNELAFMLGSDDWIEADCLKECIDSWKNNNEKDAYYYVGVRYSDDRSNPLQTLPCNAAMVTKGFWRKTGGFPVESASGAPDAALISMLLRKEPKSLVPVAGGKPLYNYRSHSETDTAKRANWQGVILETRGILTEDWPNIKWGRME